jgi:hypothetical protein
MPKKNVSFSIPNEAPSIDDAISANDVDLLRKAFRKGAVVDNLPFLENEGKLNKPTLYCAINDLNTRNNPEFFKVLFENGMEVNNNADPDKVGINSLKIALDSGASREVLSVLIENGADPKSLGDHERKPEMIRLRDEAPSSAPKKIKDSSKLSKKSQNCIIN